MRPKSDSALTPYALHRKAAEHLADGTIPAGIAFFRSVVTKSQGYTLAWQLLGRLYETAGDAERAYHAHLQAALCARRTPSSSSSTPAAMFMELARICTRQGWTERALRHLDDVLQLEPTRGDAAQLKLTLARTAQLTAEKTTKSIPAEQRSFEAIPKADSTRANGAPAGEDRNLDRPRPSPLMVRANEAFIAGRLNDAAALYRNAISESPRLATTYIGLAQTYSRLGDHAAMEKVLLEASRNQVDNEVAVLQTIGQLYTRQ